MRIAELSFPVDAELADQRCEDGLGDRGEVVERGHAVAVDAMFDPDGMYVGMSRRVRAVEECDRCDHVCAVAAG
jgi:hypothetical protein